MPGEGQRAPVGSDAPDPSSFGRAWSQARRPAAATGPVGSQLEAYNACVSGELAEGGFAAGTATLRCKHLLLEEALANLAKAPGATPRPRPAAQPLNLAHTWAGYAVKSEGMGFVYGRRGIGGVVWRLSDPGTTRATFGIQSHLLGAGLGGSVSLMAFFFLNTRNVGNIEGQAFGDEWGWDIDLPATAWAKYGKLVKAAYDAQDIGGKVNEWVELAQAVASGMTKNKVVGIDFGSVGLQVAARRGYGGKVDIFEYTSVGGTIDNL